MADNNNNNNSGSGANNAASTARRQLDDTAAKKHRAPDKLESLFPLPSCPGSGCSPPGLSSSLLPSLSSSLSCSLSSSLNHKPLLSSALPPPSHRPALQQVRTRSVGTNTQERGCADGELPQRGPCQPGTSVNLEGIVWHETQEGVLVVNVTWRKRTYVGTLLDCTKHDWAPPRFCDSPCSDPELPGGRGRGKRLRLALSDRSCLDSPAAKVRALTTPHRSRGGATSSLHKGRRGSLNLINANGRSSFFTVDDVKSPNSLSGKRKNKPPADLDLSLVGADDMKNGNGKRIRAKSRSAPSTPQGKNDPSFMDPGGGGLPILIDCPHPNCTKRYKHINGLRYHQTHAHLEAEKPETADAMKDPESEERLSDCEDAIGSYEISETSAKKSTPLYKVTTVGSPKNRRLLLSTDQNAKTRRTSILKDGLIDDLTNLPIISNMTVVLENCMVPDRNSTVEMPKLEAEGLIDKKSKKANGKVEKISKSRVNRPIAPAPAPPKLIAIPNTSFAPNSSTEPTAGQQQPLSLTTKNIPLKPIKPKLSLVVEPSLVKATLVGCSKEMKKKEKKRLKDKLAKDVASRVANGENCKIEENGTKMVAKEISGSLLKEHLSKQEVLNGISETPESRMASIRAEADKVYTFTDNAPSPSIGGSSRVDGCSVDSKNNSPAYSDISDAGEDGASKSVSSEVSANSKNLVKDNPQSPYYHGYDPYYLQGYAAPERQRKERKEDAKEDEKISEFSESKKSDGQSQLQLAMSQTALAQSLYYGQYSRGMYMDQKLVLGSKCCDPKPRGRDADEMRVGKDGSTVKSPKAAHSYVELSADRGQQRDTDELSQAELDSSAPYTTPSDGGTWRSFVHSKYTEEEPGGAPELTSGAQDREGKMGEEQDHQGALCEDSQSARAAVSPPSPQPYTQYHPPTYPPYLPSISEPSAGSYRGLSPTLVHSYPGFHYPLYGKTAGREEQEGAVTRGGAVSSKHSDSTGLELLPQTHQCHGKSPAPGEKGSPEADSDRTHVSFGRHLHSHHSALGLSYSLVQPQYDLYTGLSSRSLVSGQQSSGHSSESDGKK
ncbi:zinc finger protein 608 [Periophthalmus magnuspinnatus]|uniref:zinc finger protein 608 n=1 Tax=Periophthalmus magnuspinnatus TaxID=409849 RepID=UPI002436A8F7|nr:zinc finger protein 608 [Periophthalmus magnuspinnatus]